MVIQSKFTLFTIVFIFSLSVMSFPKILSSQKDITLSEDFYPYSMAWSHDGKGIFVMGVNKKFIGTVQLLSLKEGKKKCNIGNFKFPVPL